MTLESRPLYLITDSTKFDSLSTLIGRANSVLHAVGSRIFALQIREKSLDDETIESLCLALLPACRKRGVKLLINRRHDLALKVGLDGVHLGADSLKIPAVREQIGDKLIIGYSAHSIVEAQKISLSSCDYLFLSPIFPPLSKEYFGEPLGCSHLSELCSSVEKPVYALGGVTSDNVEQISRAGATGVAMISSVLLAPKVEDAARKILKIWDNSGQIP